MINLKTARALGLTVPLPLLSPRRRGYRMRRRAFIVGLGGRRRGRWWRGGNNPVIPTVGFLSVRSSSEFANDAATPFARA